MRRRLASIGTTLALAAGIAVFIVLPLTRGMLSKQLASAESLGEQQAAMASAPSVPAPLDRRRPARVVVELETKEVWGTLADGVKYRFWTFGGTVPGPFIRVRVGDTVQVKLKNAQDSTLPHSINFHALSGPGGGGVFQVAPGQEAAFEWKPLNPGLFIYHCMTPHVPVHIANGMYGLILVEPEKGLPRVDHEYQLVQGEFYTKGATLEAGVQPFDSEKAHQEHAEYVVWNGRMDSLLGPHALKAKVGDTVRLFVGNGGPSYTSNFHVVGAVFDTVYENGGIGAEPRRNTQMTQIAPGSAAIVEFKVMVPGQYALVDHNYFRGHEKGTVGALDAEGPEAPAIFHALSGTVRMAAGH